MERFSAFFASPQNTNSEILGNDSVPLPCGLSPKTDARAQLFYFSYEKHPFVFSFVFKTVFPPVCPEETPAAAAQRPPLCGAGRIEFNIAVHSGGMENEIMVSAGDFRNGMTFEMDGSVYQIIEFQHVKPGKGAAFVRTKIKNVIAGSVVERTFSPTEKFPTAFVERREMQYMYNETYEQIPISKDELSDNFRFVKENMDCRVLSYKGKVFGVEPPNFVELQITETDPGFKGDTATNATKPATLETGAVIKVPLFIDQGEVIRVDTRTGEYMERA